MISSYDYEDSLAEAKFLYDLCVKDNKHRELLTNLVVISLVTSIEVFAERILEYFLLEYNKLSVEAHKIERELKIAHSNCLSDRINDLKSHSHKVNDLESCFNELAKIWSSTEKITLKFDTKFPKGKHGELQIKKLFKKIGIEDVFSEVKIVIETEDMLNEEELLDIDKFIGDLTRNRNRAIHEGTRLHTFISNENLKKYIEYMESIIRQISNLVLKKLQEIEVSCTR